jgi:pimeloyl-ACP methyl ester carboxylesterase
MTHTKWIIEHSAMGLRDFADCYRFGGEGSAALVHYTGGSISWQAHQERFSSEPTPIVNEFKGAWEHNGKPRIDLIVSSAPPSGAKPRPEPLESFLEYVMDELVPKLPQKPLGYGFVGYSLGGSFATYLAGVSVRARALAVFGGAGVVEAARQVRPVLARDLSTSLFRNAEDPLQEPSTAALQLPRGYNPRAMAPRAGAHPFSDYADNGTVADAFAFVLGRLRQTD